MSISGIEIRSGFRKRSKSRSNSRGSRFVMPRAYATREPAAEPRPGERNHGGERNIGQSRPVHGNAFRGIEPPLHGVGPALAVDPVDDLDHAHEIVRSLQQGRGAAAPAQADRQQGHEGQREYKNVGDQPADWAPRRPPRRWGRQTWWGFSWQLSARWIFG